MSEPCSQKGRSFCPAGGDYHRVAHQDHRFGPFDEINCERGTSVGELCQKTAFCSMADFIRNDTVRVRINYIQSRSHHGDSGESHFKCRFVGDGVRSYGKTGDDDWFFGRIVILGSFRKSMDNMLDIVGYPRSDIACADDSDTSPVFLQEAGEVTVKIHVIQSASAVRKGFNAHFTSSPENGHPFRACYVEYLWFHGLLFFD